MRMLKLTRPDGLTVIINADSICMFSPVTKQLQAAEARSVLYLMNGTQAVTESLPEIMEMLNGTRV